MYEHDCAFKRLGRCYDKAADSFSLFQRPSVTRAQASHISWQKQSTNQWQCPSQLQLLINVISRHAINACDHMSCLLAALCLGVQSFITFLCAPKCEWVTLARECVHVCHDCKSAFPRWIALLSSVAAPPRILMDSRRMWVRPFGDLFPFAIEFVFRFSRIPSGRVQKEPKTTDIQEKILISWFIMNKYIWIWIVDCKTCDFSLMLPFRLCILCKILEITCKWEETNDKLLN